jgi:hypothetical protein
VVDKADISLLDSQHSSDYIGISRDLEVNIDVARGGKGR